LTGTERSAQPSRDRRATKRPSDLLFRSEHGHLLERDKHGGPAVGEVEVGEVEVGEVEVGEVEVGEVEVGCV
jgi:hypothetical protein